MNVGELIKQTRLQRGMTQEELADKVGVQKSAIAKWENGRVSEIKRSNLKNLADALGLAPTQLLGNDLTGMYEIKEPAIALDGFTENQRKLIDFVQTVPEDKAEMILRVIQSIVESD